MYEILATLVFCFIVVLISSIVINRRYKKDYGLDITDNTGTHTGFQYYYIMHNADVLYWEPIIEERQIVDLSTFRVGI
jgi:hypothetical protein